MSKKQLEKTLYKITAILNNHIDEKKDLVLIDYDDYMGYDETTINYEVISEIQNVKNYELVISDIRIDTILQCMYIYYTNEAQDYFMREV